MEQATYAELPIEMGAYGFRPTNGAQLTLFT